VAGAVLVVSGAHLGILGPLPALRRGQGGSVMSRDSWGDRAAYVECSECGHPLERHGLGGCDGEECPCRVRWTVREIQEARRAEGLPIKYKAWNY